MAIRKIKKVLIANRGEIALRIMRTVQELGLDAVVIYEKPDRNAYYVRLADDAIMIGEGPRKDYLDVDKVIWAAKKSGADAIHPGYGFLAENADFSAGCEKEGIIFIGPPPQVIRDLGNKVVARKIMQKAGIPFIPGTGDLVRGSTGINEAFAFAAKQGYPVMLKASSGGGGRGIRKVVNEADLIVQLPQARSEALSAFNDENIYMESSLKRHGTWRSRSWQTSMAVLSIWVPGIALFSVDTRNCSRLHRQNCQKTFWKPCMIMPSKRHGRRDTSMPELLNSGEFQDE